MMSEKTGLQFDLDSANAVPIHRQIYDRVSRAVLEGHLKAGARLPSARSLAAQLGVARGTVETAYHQLAGEGYIVTRGAAGTLVSKSLKRTLLHANQQFAWRDQVKLEEGPSAAEPALFQMGLPALDLFPQALWNRLLNQQARALGRGDLAHPNPVGLEALRVQTAAYLAVARGIVCSPAEVIITGGYQGALGLISRCLLRPGDRVWLENPCYPDSRDAMRFAGASVVGIPVDRDGFRLPDAVSSKAPARLVMVTPTHQFPTGVTLSLSRRVALLNWAAENEAWIVEDDYDSEYRYQGKPLPALKSLDRQERVLYAGTFSKVISPSLRVGYLVVPTALTRHFFQAAALLQPPPSALIQATIAAFLERGHLGRHIRRMRGRYAERRTALTAALQERISSLRIELQPGGMHLLGRLPKGKDDVALVARLKAQGIGPTALSACGLEAPYASGLLIGFTNVDCSMSVWAAQQLASAGDLR